MTNPQPSDKAIQVARDFAAAVNARPQAPQRAVEIARTLIPEALHILVPTYEARCEHAANLIQAYAQQVADAQCAPLVEALEKLAKLGNGEVYGNSDGNMMARTALSTYHKAKQGGNNNEHRAA